MENFINRVPTFPNKKKIVFSDGRTEFAEITNADEPTKDGTRLNKLSLNKMQDLVDYEISFGETDITQTYFDKSKSVTTFGDDGSIIESYYDSGNELSLVKTTSFDDDGNIIVEVITYE